MLGEYPDVKFVIPSVAQVQNLAPERVWTRIELKALLAIVRVRFAVTPLRFVNFDVLFRGR
jgi:hypothetical protein